MSIPLASTHSGIKAEALPQYISIPAASLSGTKSTSSGGGGCFISSAQEAFNQDIMHGLAFLGFVVILWRLIMRIKTWGRRAGRRSSSRGGANSAFDEIADFGFRVITEQEDLAVRVNKGPAGKPKQVSDLAGEPPTVA